MNRCFLMITLVVLVGCGGGGGNQESTHKVSGKVTMGGAAVAGATVTFSPETAGRPAAVGLTDGQGVYKLTTYAAGDGAPEGSYKVMVYKEAPKEESSAPQHDPKNGSTPQGPPGPKGHGGANKKGGPAGSLLPPKYASSQDTPLKKSVTSGENTIDLEL